MKTRMRNAQRMGRKAMASVLAGAVLLASPLGCRNERQEPVERQPTVYDWLRDELLSSSERNSKTVRVNLALDLDVTQIVGLCPISSKGIKVSPGREHECDPRGMVIEMGKAVKIDGITMIGTDDSGVMFIENGEIKGCNFFSNGEKATFESKGRTIEICCSHSEDGMPQLFVRTVDRSSEEQR